MLLYDVFYTGNSMDTAIPLPKNPPKGTKYAACVNGEADKIAVKRSKTSPTGLAWAL